MKTPSLLQYRVARQHQAQPTGSQTMARLHEELR